MTTRTPRAAADMLAQLVQRSDFSMTPGLHTSVPRFPREYAPGFVQAWHAQQRLDGMQLAIAAARLDFCADDEPPACLYEPPPAGPDSEPEDEFQRQIDELLSERRPLWRDFLFWTCVLGVWAFGMAAACYLIAH